MRTSWLAYPLLAAVVILMGCGPRWRRVDATDGSFSVDFPKAPTTSLIERTSAGRLRREYLLVATFGAEVWEGPRPVLSFLAGYVEQDGMLASAATLDECASDVAPALVPRGRDSLVRDFAAFGHSGREVVREGDGTARGWILATPGRCYRLFVLGTNLKDPEAAQFVDRFFRSFALQRR